MGNEDLFSVVESITARDLKELVAVKGRLVGLEKKKGALEKQLAAVTQEIEAIRKLVAKRWAKRSRNLPLAGAAVAQRSAQPSLASLIVEVLKKEKKALGINEICDAVLKEKHYRTRSKDFKAQVRVLIYKNDKGLFKKTAPGLFTLA